MKWNTRWDGVDLIADNQQDEKLLEQLFKALSNEPDFHYEEPSATLENFYQHKGNTHKALIIMR